MSITTPDTRRASRSYSRRTNFARSAVYAAFGQGAQALFYDIFVDRPPDQEPRLIWAPRPTVRLPPLGGGRGQ